MEKKTKTPISSYSKSTNGYKALLQHIIRMKKGTEEIEQLNNSPNDLANFYIDVFLLCTAEISGPVVVAAKFCEENRFSAWRSKQKRAGNLDWDVTLYGDNKKSVIYKPGVKLAKYLATITTENSLNATKGYVDKELTAVKSELREMKDAFDKLIEFFDPPVSNFKQVYYRNNPNLLFKSKSGKSVMRNILDEEDDVEVNKPEHPDYSEELKN